MSSTDPLRVHLSLVSHTNIGKTTLARTLLLRDVGEVADRAHVTETTDDYVLARGPAGCELVLWDTPGFGHSVRLSERLAQRGNPVGWFLSEVWDRFTDRAFWLDQKLVRHVRDTSDIVLYLVNAAEPPESAGYVDAEMRILSWIGKPVIVLLNQMGRPRNAEDEAADVNAWRATLASYALVREVLPMDAFARCWVQEAALFDAIGLALPPERQATYNILRDVWVRARRATYANSVDALAHHLVRLMGASELAPATTLKDHVLTVAKHFGLLKSKSEGLADAQAALSSMAADGLCALTNKLIDINGLTGSGISKEILRRMKTDWNMAVYTIDPSRAAAVGAGMGAASGVAADLSVAGLSLGLATLVGGVIGALGALGAAAVYNARHKKEGVEISWSTKALTSFTLEALLLYLAVAHFGRGRGDWHESESPAFWKDALEKALKQQPVDFTQLRELSPEDAAQHLSRALDSLLRAVFFTLYGRSV